MRMMQTVSIVAVDISHNIKQKFMQYLLQGMNLLFLSDLLDG